MKFPHETIALGLAAQAYLNFSHPSYDGLEGWIQAYRDLDESVQSGELHEFPEHMAPKIEIEANAALEKIDDLAIVYKSETQHLFRQIEGALTEAGADDKLPQDVSEIRVDELLAEQYGEDLPEES